MTNPDDQRRAYTLGEFCELYRTGRSFTYGEIRAGRLKAVKAGSKTLILKADAQAWEQSLRAIAAAPKVPA